MQGVSPIVLMLVMLVTIYFLMIHPARPSSATCSAITSSA